MLLIAGGQEEVLRRAEELTAGLEAYRQRGVLKSIFSPTDLLPSARTQRQRAGSLAGIDLAASARALEDSLRENGFRIEPHQPFIERLRKLGQGAEPVTLEKAAEFLPPGLLDNSIRKTSGRQLRRGNRLLCHRSQCYPGDSGDGPRVLAESIWSVRGVLLRQDQPRHAEPSPSRQPQGVSCGRRLPSS